MCCCDKVLVNVAACVIPVYLCDTICKFPEGSVLY